MGGEGMPFVASKGPLLNYLDAHYSAAAANVGERIDILERLRYGWRPGATMGGTIDSIEHAVGPDGYPATQAMLEDFFVGSPVSTTVPVALRNHLNRHWFGYQTDVDGHALNQTQDPGATSTGWWSNWKGDAEGVFREGMIRALEVSLRINHRASTAAPAYAVRPPLPIDFTWICGAPRFEVYVRWRREGDNGMVMVTFVTPASDQLLLAPSFSALAGVVESPEEIDTKVLADDIGMIVIGQDTLLTEPAPDVYHVDALGAPRVAALEWKAAGVGGGGRPAIQWVNDPTGTRPGGIAQLPIDDPPLPAQSAAL